MRICLHKRGSGCWLVCCQCARRLRHLGHRLDLHLCCRLCERAGGLVSNGSESEIGWLRGLRRVRRTLGCPTMFYISLMSASNFPFYLPLSKGREVIETYHAVNQNMLVWPSKLQNQEEKTHYKTPALCNFSIAQAGGTPTAETNSLAPDSMTISSSSPSWPFV